MSSAEDWVVAPSSPMETLAENLWRVEGTIPQRPLKRVMTIAKRTDGKLVIHNAIALDEAGMKALEALGEIGYIVVPNAFHRIDAARFAKRYPDAKIICPTGSKKRVAEQVEVDGALEDIPADDAVSFEAVDGIAGAEGVMVVKSEDGVTLVVNDLVFNMPHQQGVGGFFLRHVTASSGGPTMSRIARLFLVKDAAKVKAELERLANTKDLVRVIVSHHETITDKPADALRAVAATL